jgi:hypothetical protein
MCLSSVRSATKRFNRAFSSSSCRRRRSSLTPRCAYFLRAAPGRGRHRCGTWRKARHQGRSVTV